MDDKMTVKQAEILALTMAGYSLADIAREKNVSRQAIHKQYKKALEAIEKDNPNSLVLDGREIVKGLIVKAIDVQDEAMNPDQPMKHRLQASKNILDGAQVFIKKSEVKESLDMKEYLELKRQAAVWNLEHLSPEREKKLCGLFGLPYDDPEG